MLKHLVLVNECKILCKFYDDEKLLLILFFTTHCFAYLNDIIIVSKSFKEHLYRLKNVLDNIHGAGLTIVNERGFEPDAERVVPVLNYPSPRNIKQFRKFFGIASCHRRFI